MDELNVVRKRSHVWAWVVGLIVLALIIWAIVAMSGHRANGSAPTSELRPDPGARPTAVADRLKL